jgi:hypothetical protein
MSLDSVFCELKKGITLCKLERSIPVPTAIVDNLRDSHGQRNVRGASELIKALISTRSE